MSNTLNCRMPGLRTLLLATDGSRYRGGAAREAINLAKQCSLILNVVTVMEAPTDDDGFPLRRIEEALEAEVRNKLDVFKILASSRGVTCEAIIETGEPAATIA